MRPLVTIGVCARNCKSVIKDAVDSVIIQDFPHENMELILVDDGSEDGTLSVLYNCKSMTDIKTSVFHHEWKGLGHTRNVVVNNARGDYIIWVDADTILSRDFVKRQVDFLNQNPKVGIAGGRRGIIGREKSVVATLETLAFVARDLKYEGVNSEKLPGTAGSIYRVCAVKHVGGFDESIKGAGEDTDITYRVTKAGWRIYLSTPAVFYERCKESWISLWNQYLWHGYGLHYVFHKNSGIEKLYELLPNVAFLSGLMLLPIAYRTIRRKVVFLLPFHFVFKMTAWWIGYIKGHMNSYRNNIK